MGVNKVVFGDVPVMDISDSTVTPNTLCAGNVAYGADGEKVVGVNPYEKEATDAEVSEQENLIQQIKTVLEGKAAGGGSGGDTKYIKFTAKPESTTSFSIQNPLGGIAKIVSINRVSGTATSNIKISKCVVSWGIKYGAVYAVYTGGTVKYGIDGVTGSPNNAQFTVTDGTIKIYRYNSSTTWDDSNEYEVEIWQ